MPRFRRIEVLQAMYSSGLVPLAHHADAEVAFGIASACSRAGARLLEFTNRGDRAFMSFAKLEERCAKEIPQLIVGAGSIVDAGSASLFIDCGAAFIVGPSFDDGVARACNRRKIAYVPGCATVSEIARAEESGCELIKLFPGEAFDGPAFIKAVRAPRPWTSLMPTGGVTCDEENLAAWFGAGASCVGMGSGLIRKEHVQGRDYQAIARDVETALGLIAKVRSGRPRADAP